MRDRVEQDGESMNRVLTEFIPARQVSLTDRVHDQILELIIKNATEEEMVQAARTSHAHEFIKRLPNGYDTYIKGDDGSLSQGEKQLLCIARLMLALPPMLILDEATSSIDTRTEMKIQEAFQTMMEGRTTFVVAHRLSTIREADVILYMQDGKVLEQGNHQELLEKNGYYAKLYRSQFVCGK